MGGAISKGQWRGHNKRKDILTLQQQIKMQKSNYKVLKIIFLRDEIIKLSAISA